MLLDMEPLLKIIKLTLQTGYIKSLSKPVSLLIIAKPESAKTSAMQAFYNIKGTYTTNALTQAVIVEKIFPMIESKGLKHLLIPDILNCLGVAKTTREGFENMIKSLIEEGITSLDKFHLKTNKVYDPAIKCGLITAITSGSYQGDYNPTTQRLEGGVKHVWKKTGLLSRFIPFSYSYSILKISEVFKYIHKEEQKKKGKKEVIKRKLHDIKGDPTLFAQFDVLSNEAGREIGAYGIRITQGLQELAKANVILRGGNKVLQEDIDEILRLGNWINYSFNPL